MSLISILLYGKFYVETNEVHNFVLKTLNDPLNERGNRCNEMLWVHIIIMHLPFLKQGKSLSIFEKLQKKCEIQRESSKQCSMHH